MKNHQHIRNLKVKDLAPYLIKSETVPDYDEGLDGEWFQCGEHTWYITPSGLRCWDYKEAIQCTIDWLNSDYCENTK